MAASGSASFSKESFTAYLRGRGVPEREFASYLEGAERFLAAYPEVLLKQGSLERVAEFEAQAKGRGVDQQQLQRMKLVTQAVLTVLGRSLDERPAAPLQRADKAPDQQMKQQEQAAVPSEPLAPAPMLPILPVSAKRKGVEAKQSNRRLLLLTLLLFVTLAALAIGPSWFRGKTPTGKSPRRRTEQ